MDQKQDWKEITKLLCHLPGCLFFSLVCLLLLIMRNLKVLIIDDEKDYCMIMKSYFLGRHYEVSVAYDLKEGLKLLGDIQPDILLLDNNLPDGKGRDHIDSIVAGFPSLKIYLISAYHQKGDFLSPPENVTVWEKPIVMSVLDQTFPSGINS